MDSQVLTLNYQHNMYSQNLVAFIMNSIKILSKMEKKKHENKNNLTNKTNYKFKGLLVTHLNVGEHMSILKKKGCS